MRPLSTILPGLLRQILERVAVNSPDPKARQAATELLARADQKPANDVRQDFAA